MAKGKAIAEMNAAELIMLRGYLDEGDPEWMRENRIGEDGRQAYMVLVDAELERRAAMSERDKLLDRARRADEEAQDARANRDEMAHAYWADRAERLERKADAINAHTIKSSTGRQ
jgi:hypothetical protein